MYIAFPRRSRKQPPDIFGIGVSADDAVLAAKIQCSGDSERYDRDALAPELDTAPCSDALAARYAETGARTDYRIADGMARLADEAAPQAPAS